MCNVQIILNHFRISSLRVSYKVLTFFCCCCFAWFKLCLITYVLFPFIGHKEASGLHNLIKLLMGDLNSHSFCIKPLINNNKWPHLHNDSQGFFADLCCSDHRQKQNVVPYKM